MRRPGAWPNALGPDAVVLLTGGARGITAQAALAIARECRGCRIELAGRSPLPAGLEAAAVAAAPDRAALRQVLLEAGTHTTPAAIEAECTRLLAEREIRATLANLEQLGSAVAYHQVDVRDADALASLVADIDGAAGSPRPGRPRGRASSTIASCGTRRPRASIASSPPRSTRPEPCSTRSPRPPPSPSSAA